MTDGLDYIGEIWTVLRAAYDMTLPAGMPEDLRHDETAQSAIREARHAIHEAMSHLADVSIRLHHEGETQR